MSENRGSIAEEEDPFRVNLISEENKE